MASTTINAFAVLLVYQNETALPPAPSALEVRGEVRGFYRNYGEALVAATTLASTWGLNLRHPLKDVEVDTTGAGAEEALITRDETISDALWLVAAVVDVGQFVAAHAQLDALFP